MSAGSALAVLYGLRHFLKPGFGSLTELALIVSCSTAFLVLAVAVGLEVAVLSGI